MAQAAGLTVRCFAPLSMTTYGAVAVWPEISVETAKFPNEPNRAASQAKNRFCQPL